MSLGVKLFKPLPFGLPGRRTKPYYRTTLICYCGDQAWYLPEFISEMQRALAQVPAEHRSACTVEIEHDSDGDSCGVSFIVYWGRDQTPEEAEADERTARTQRALDEANRQADLENTERETLARLKAKYEKEG